MKEFRKIVFIISILLLFYSGTTKWANTQTFGTILKITDYLDIASKAAHMNKGHAAWHGNHPETYEISQEIETCQNLPVRIAGITPVYYSKLQDAYDDAGNGDTIQSHDDIFYERLNINLNKSVTLEGGYDCSYMTITGKTTVNGALTISNGIVTIENLEITNNGGIRAIESVIQVGQLTGQPSMNNTGQVNVFGTDLGSMFLHSDDRIYFLFGDTFGYPGPPGSSGDWRSNTMAYTTDFVASDGITFDGWITDFSGLAKALVEGNHDPNNGTGEVTKIPTAGWSVEDRQFMWFMSVKQWGTPGEWEVNYSEIAYSDDNGNSWFHSGTQMPGNSNFIQVAVAEQSGYLHFWGIPAGRFGGVKLARVLPSQVLDKTAYQYYTGISWSPHETDGVLIVEEPVGELSVLWNPYLNRWIMMYLNENTASIEVREAPNPTGPWSEPWEVVNANDYPALYGAFMHDRYIEENGKAVYFLMSQFGPYNVFLMKVVFQ